MTTEIVPIINEESYFLIEENKFLKSHIVTANISSKIRSLLYVFTK